MGRRKTLTNVKSPADAVQYKRWKRPSSTASNVNAPTPPDGFFTSDPCMSSAEQTR